MKTVVGELYFELPLDIASRIKHVRIPGIPSIDEISISDRLNRIDVEPLIISQYRLVYDFTV